MIGWRSCFLALGVLITGCNGGAPSPPPFFTGTSAPLLQHLYVADGTQDLSRGNPGASVWRFTLPITSTSTPDLSLVTENMLIGVALDATGNLAVVNQGTQVQLFAAPISAGSSPTATFQFSKMEAGSAAFTAAGDMFAVSRGDSVNGRNGNVVFVARPFSNASTPSLTITDPVLTQPFAAVTDAASNLYVSIGFPRVGPSGRIVVFAPPYTGAPVVTPAIPGTAYRPLAIRGTRLFVGSVPDTLPGSVDVYDLPITASSAPAFSITTGVNSPKGLAFDAAGNLYVGNYGDATITMYRPPFSAASAPGVTVRNVQPPVPGAPGIARFSLNGIAIGP